ncbi:PHO85 cyclin-5 [Entomophthora muscae]|uniref:PHO85 cyclin-5 n=1 Tax=Entomophthora muscae TaxID=34485 RepID=A0ACC2RNJ9_9FUNG|nr:PHO85 cyclin-5 [Entomophthora muscae]
MLSAIPHFNNNHLALYSPKLSRCSLEYSKPNDKVETKLVAAKLAETKVSDLSANLYVGRFWTESITNCQNIFNMPPMHVPHDPLVSFVVMTVQYIWPNFNSQISTFVHHLITTFRFDTSTIYLAIIYCYRAKHAVDIRRYAAARQGWQHKADNASCGRRMLLGAILSASKFLADKGTSNHKWARLAGVSAHEITQITTSFLKLIDYRLHVEIKEYEYIKRNLICFHSPVELSHSLSLYNDFL